MAGFCWFLKFIFLLVMMSRASTIDCRPMFDDTQSDVIAGNEFLKLFGDDEQFQAGGSHQTAQQSVALEIGKPASSNRSNNARSLEYKTRHNENAQKDDKQQQVVKLVTSGSKIVFLEEYDDDDAIVDAVAREIDLQREQKLTKTTSTTNSISKKNNGITNHERHLGNNNADDFKVVAVSVSSSSKRASATSKLIGKNQQQQQQENQQAANKSKAIFKTNKANATITTTTTTTVAPKTKKKTSTTTTSTTTTTTSAIITSTTTATTVVPYAKRREIASTWRPLSALPYANDDFINLSHKSELSIEETEPLTMSQQSQQQKSQRSYRGKKTHGTSLETDNDSENSASTNIQNILAAPLSHSFGGTNKTNMSNHNTSNQENASKSNNNSNNNSNKDDSDGTSTGMEDKLLPFQTVIYHDTRDGEGRGPQSRSISYSSLSQNVEDLHTWQRTGGILAEAQRNVSESLNPLLNAKSNTKLMDQETAEPAKFYSVPSKVYGEPAKFYSQPSKVYSEPSKIYGESEKFYSEPSKVYGEPSKFYSEPSKVYSQPAKVYGEPSKTYWPQAATEVSSTTMAATKDAYIAPSRRPAIVSRIAFGEAQSPSSIITNTTTTKSPIVYRNHHSHYTPTRLQTHQHQPQKQQQQHQQQQEQQHKELNSQPRRVLFNLDRLPYDLLNAPEPVSKQLGTEPMNLADLSHGPISCFDSELPLTSSVSTSASSSTATAQTAVSSLTVTHQPQQQQLLLIQQRQQHSSLSDQQHSNQNAKGLPNRDLVKCVAKYIHARGAAPAASSTAQFTTERSHSDDMYSPTPEQNYEIEESVSVMSNGRAHGIVGSGTGRFTTTTTTSRPIARNRLRNGYQHGSKTNANNHNHHHHHQHQHNNDDYEDDGSYNYEDDNDEAQKTKQENADDDDSKVAYVVEGQNYRKYRVEEKTDDGFIVGEYGVVDHNDGNLRGVRYTADSTINPSLIQKALLTFLKLK